MNKFNEEKHILAEVEKAKQWVEDATGFAELEYATKAYKLVVKKAREFYGESAKESVVNPLGILIE